MSETLTYKDNIKIIVAHELQAYKDTEQNIIALLELCYDLSPGMFEETTADIIAVNCFSKD